MELWIPITLAAAFTQNLRFMLQRHLRATGLSTGGATFSRFVFAAPLALVLTVALAALTGDGVPVPSLRFVAFAAAGGLAQIAATMLVVALFTRRNFAVGITFKKTETIQTALIGAMILGEGISTGGLGAIVLGLVGVLLLSDPPGGGKGWGRIFNRAAGYGLAAGALFGVSAVGYRGASLELGDAHFALRALVTLALVTLFQSAVMGLWLRLQEPGEIGRVLAHWRVTALVGLFGMVGSACWFAAFTLQNAAYVKAVGQVELVFSLLASWLIFREPVTGRELLGTALVVASILLIALAL